MSELIQLSNLAQHGSETFQVCLVVRLKLWYELFHILWDILVILMADYLEGEYQMCQQWQKQVLLLCKVNYDVQADLPQELGRLHNFLCENAQRVPEFVQLMQKLELQGATSDAGWFEVIV